MLDVCVSLKLFSPQNFNKRKCVLVQILGGCLSSQSEYNAANHWSLKRKRQEQWAEFDGDESRKLAF